MRGLASVSLIVGFVAIVLAAILFVASPPSHRAATRTRFVVGPLTGVLAVSDIRWIAIEDGRIDSIGAVTPRELLESPIGAGLYATPGLIDMHVHLPPEFLPGQIDLFSLLFLSHGVTTVREMGTTGINITELTDRAELGTRIAPRTFSCGIPLSGTPTQAPFAASVEGESEVRAAIRRNATDGADCIKIYRGFPQELLDIAREEAAARGIPLVGHLPMRARWDETRIADIQHICDPRCFSLRQPAIKALVGAGRRSLVRHTPTLVAFDGPLQVLHENADPALDLMPRIWREVFWAAPTLRILGFSALNNPASYVAMHARILDAAEQLIDANATLQTGSDTPHPFVVPGASLHREMKLLTQAGLTVSESWQAATSIPGSFLPLDGLGTLEVGAPADLLLFREDPRASLNALDTLEIVIADGRVYPIAELRDRLRAQIEYVDGPVYEYAIEPAVRVTLRLVANYPEWLSTVSAMTR